MAEITKIICSACGAKVDQKEESDLFFCSYCGNQFIVERKNGEAHFLQNDTRIASEMAINRIKSEISSLNAQRDPYSINWDRLNRIHTQSLNFKLWTKVFLWSFLGSFILLIIGVAIDKMAIGILAFFTFLGGIIGLIVNAGNSRKRKLSEKDYESMSLFMIPMNSNIDNKLKELQRHQRVVEK